MSVRAKATARAGIASRKQAFVRDEIVTVAINLFAERGYRAVTLDDVSANLGYTKSVVYYYFKSKNEILWQIFQRIMEGFRRPIEQIQSQNLPPDLALKQMIRQHALSVTQNREWTAIYNREESELDPTQRKQIRRLKRDYDALFETAFEDGVAKGLFRDMPTHVVINGAIGMCNWLHVWYDEKGPLTGEQIADLYADLLAKGYCVGDKA